MILATTCEKPYSISKALLSKYLDIDITEMQLCRITTHYGEALMPVLASTKVLHSLTDKEECVYAQADGSMILTREEQWKEVKLGRIFCEKACLQVLDKVDSIKALQYVAHLGNHKVFTQNMESVLDDYGRLGKRLIFITDGAKWLKNWIEDAYPQAVSILDFYHAKEYLCQFAKDYFTHEAERHNWIKQQETLLLESQTQQVIDEVYRLNNKSYTPSAIKVIDYYSSNLKRMDYKYYQTIGKGLIGSGAIESAHRTVVQSRMKLSGQRWSNEGAKKLLALRNINMNKQWEEVVKLIKMAA